MCLVCDAIFAQINITLKHIFKGLDENELIYCTYVYVFSGIFCHMDVFPHIGHAFTAVCLC